MSRRYRGRGRRQNSIEVNTEVVTKEVKKNTVVTNAIDKFDPTSGTPRTGGVARATNVNKPPKQNEPFKAPVNKTLTYKEQKIADATLILPSAKDTSGIRTNILYQILSMKRPAGSAMEEEMIKKYIDVHKPIIDKFGNRCIQIPLSTGETAKTMFSCHTDTVHRDDGYQKLYLDTTLEEVFVDDSGCLGADDGTGIYIMLMMIKHKVPGTYLFHRSEEVGCRGSKYILEKNVKWLKQFDACIAFDRKGKDEVIIAQAPGIIASDKYGDALAEALTDKKAGTKFSTSKLGSITDSGQYYECIPECINLSVGYMRQHTPSETQSISFLQKILPILIKLDWEKLPVERKAGPAKPKYEPTQYGTYGRGGHNSYNSYQQNKPTPAPVGASVSEKKLAMLVLREPRVAIELLINAGVTADDLWTAEWEALQYEADMLGDYSMYNM